MQGLVERAARGAEALGEHVDRHLVQRERDEHGALVRRELLAHRALQRPQELGALAALLEAAVKLRRRAWQGREVPLEPEAWSLFSSRGPAPDEETEQGELVAAVQQGIRDVLTPHQRQILVALALNGVPIDVLADRLTTTRGALYKTLHDARTKLRRVLAAAGHIEE